MFKHFKRQRAKRTIIKVFRILMFSLRGVFGPRIQQQSAALTLYMLLSVVPIFALGFGIAKGFNYDKLLKKEVMSYMNDKIAYAKANVDNPKDITLWEEYKHVVEQIITMADTLLAKTQGGLVAGIGIILLVWTIMKVFGGFESSLNDIWHIRKGRSMLRKFSDYIAMMLISPILFFSASAANVLVVSFLEKMSKKVELVNVISPFLVSLINLAPYLLIYVLFTTMYMVMPNTKVRLQAAILGGFIAGSVFQITQLAYIHFQIGVSTNNAIYGTFAAIPLFILWMQTSWMIVLFGAKVAYATQNFHLFEYEKEINNISEYSRRMLALQITHRVIHNFQKGNDPISSEVISDETKIPISLTEGILSELVKCKILAEVVSSNTQKLFLPGRSLDSLSVRYIMNQLDRNGEMFVAVYDKSVNKRLAEIHAQFDTTIENHPDNVLLKDI